MGDSVMSIRKGNGYSLYAATDKDWAELKRREQSAQPIKPKPSKLEIYWDGEKWVGEYIPQEIEHH